MTHKPPKGPVGYGNPPDHSKFKKGKSGNPSGRPKAVRDPVCEDPIKALLREEISASVKGKRTRMPAYEGLLRALLKKGLQGDTKAIQMLFTQTNGLATILDEKRREANSADLAFIEAVRKEANEWLARDPTKEDNNNE